MIIVTIFLSLFVSTSSFSQKETSDTPIVYLHIGGTGELLGFMGSKDIRNYFDDFGINMAISTVKSIAITDDLKIKKNESGLYGNTSF